MTTAATSLLGLALPVTGELSGTWGDTVNNAITSLLDTAVAGTTTLSTDGDVTLTTTTLAANQARQAILLCSGARTALRTITAPAQSKIYTVINATTGGFSVKVVGVGPTTGVTIVAGESAVIAWNGSDFIKVSNTAGAGVFSSITNTSLTSGRVVYSTTGGLETDSANLLYSGTDLTVYGITVGRGAGAVSTNTAVGASALAANTTGAYNTILGATAGDAITTGNFNTLLGFAAGSSVTTASANTAIGQDALSATTTGASNVAVGNQALQSNTTASNNTAVGYQAGYSGATNTGVAAFGYQALYNSTGNDNAAFGAQALKANTTGARNTAMGTSTSGATDGALGKNTTGDDNTAVGHQANSQNTTGGRNTAIGSAALYSNTTASNNTAVGYQAGYSNTTGLYLAAFGNFAARSNTTGLATTAIGYNALRLNTTGDDNTAVGFVALESNTTGARNSAVGSNALIANTTGSNNTAHGTQALQANTTASNNTAVGYQAGYSNTTGIANTYIGEGAGFTNTASSYNTFVGEAAGRSFNTNVNAGNTFVGVGAGYGTTTGTANTFVGAWNPTTTVGCGQLVTTGSRNTILGAYNGNQGGLDIRTANNNIVLSDGDGNPRLYYLNSGATWRMGNVSTNIDWVSSLSSGDSMPYIYFPTRNDGTTNTSQSGSGIIQYFNDNNGSAPASVNFVRTGGTGGGVSSGSAVTFNATRNTYSPYGAYTNAEVFRATGIGVINFENNGFDTAGIQFPATQKASSNANTLDDYEEGTWTPAIRGALTAGTYELATAEGGYIKIGKQVTLFARVVFAGSITGGGTGYMQITGAPSFNNARVSCGTVKQSGLDLSAGYTWLTVGHVGSSGQTTLYFDENGDAATSNDFPISGVSAGDNFYITLTYEASA